MASYKSFTALDFGVCPLGLQVYFIVLIYYFSLRSMKLLLLLLQYLFYLMKCIRHIRGKNLELCCISWKAEHCALASLLGLKMLHRTRPCPSYLQTCTYLDTSIQLKMPRDS